MVRLATMAFILGLGGCGGTVPPGVDGGRDGGEDGGGEGGPVICNGVECPEGAACVEGQCRAEDLCAGVVCSNPSEACRDGICVSGEADLDGDGYRAREDCDDADPTVVPGSVRVCTNGCGEGTSVCGPGAEWTACEVDRCDLPHAAEAVCVEERCVLIRCEEGWGDCDGDAGNGCEAEPTWTALEGGDHCGWDWSPADGARLGGRHVGVGQFTVAAGTTVRVAALGDGGTGELTVEAVEIDVAGRVDATGAGHFGGARRRRPGLWFSLLRGERRGWREG